MKTQELIFTQPYRVELQEREISSQLAGHEALIQSECSIVSAGTEGSGFTGLIQEMPSVNTKKHEIYPMKTGYGHLGRVLEIGKDVNMCKVGDRVLSFSNHASLVKADAVRFALPVPEDINGKKVVFSRMAGVGISALRSSTVQPGDTVLVIGQGLVGNFAAQLFQLAGAEVVVSEINPLRIEKSRACGIERVINPNEVDLTDYIMDWTKGKGVRIAIEAIGLSELAAEAVMLTQSYGETILLGTPRAPSVFDATPMLFRIHMEAIRLIGSLEWRWPSHQVARHRHNIVDNYRQIVNWIMEDKITVEPLLTHEASPEDCQQIFTGLTQDKDNYLSAVFDWQKLACSMS